MELTEIVTKHQKQYFDFFSKASKACEGAKEILVDRKNDDPEEIYRLYRFDCINKNNNSGYEIIEYNNDSYLNHAPITFLLHELKVIINPFFWNGAEIEVWGMDKDMHSIIKWAEKWIDVNDTKSIPKNGIFSGLIHSILRPEISRDKVILSIDFGTSEITSFMQLMDILESNGANKVVIHSKTLIEGK